MRKTGFTLVELLIVIIIIGILAAVSMPMMRSMKTRAIASEAIAGIGAIRTGVKAYYAEYGSYPRHSVWIKDDDLFMQQLGFQHGDLNGAYFSEDCYWYSDLDSPGGEIVCVTWLYQNEAPREDETASIGNGWIRMHFDGTITQNGIPGLEYPEEN
ncbi:MAG: prepilin-type N-terminal cleavage/methylation domain-containing protein [Candidatus Omnitrophota bacterium]|nr:prepilin-type N-terminal cleavage/methylation domain-containing protein [Candidatus Omnitrophota bacterium]